MRSPLLSPVALLPVLLAGSLFLIGASRPNADRVAADPQPSATSPSPATAATPGEPTAIRAVPAKMAFQGYLTDNGGTPINASVTLVVRLWNAASGGSLVWGPETHAGVSVDDGVFAIKMGETVALDPSDFSGSALWVGVQVNGEAELPRTELLTSPFAMRAVEADHATTADVGMDTDWTIVGDNMYAAPSGEVGVGVIPTARPAPEIKDGEPAALGLAARKFEVYGTNNQSIYSTSLETDDTLDDRAAVYGFRTRNIASPGSGYNVSQTNVAVKGYNFWGDPYTFGVAGYSFNDFTETGGVIGSKQDGSYWGALGYKDANSKGWGQFTPSDAYVGLNLGVGAQTPQAKIHAASTGAVEVLIEADTNNVGEADNASLRLSQDGGLIGAVVGFVNSSNDLTLMAYDNVDSTRITLRQSGIVEVDVLQISGGADLAEPFDVLDRASVQPGMVMAIDPANAGALRVARHAYDRTVAGVASGANGVRPGIQLKQSGTAADGSVPLALTGRCYCLVDASFGAIEPGDLLTTSTTPGHAMKVTDHERARGAVIGKAMTGLTAGKGHVLVLVSLQ